MILPLYNSLAPLTLNRVFAAAPAYDPDAQAYIDAVELEDGQALEVGVKDAINDFVVGCKSDGIWSALKASCILAGARTLDGALVPLVGSSPTSNNFVSGDYDRESGLIGNGTTKYINSNRNNNTDPQDNQHLAVYITSVSINDRAIIGTSPTTGTSSIIARAGGLNRYNVRSRRQTVGATPSGSALSGGFAGISRNASASFIARGDSNNTTISGTSETPQNQLVHVFAANAATIYAGRLSFYSIGESLDLALLDTRVSSLMTDLAAAI